MRVIIIEAVIPRFGSQIVGLPHYYSVTSSKLSALVNLHYLKVHSANPQESCYMRGCSGSGVHLLITIGTTIFLSGKSLK